MDNLMINEARHILVVFLSKGRSTSYGIRHTSVTKSVARLRKEGYVEVTGNISLPRDLLLNKELELDGDYIDFFYVKPTEKLIAMKDDLISNTIIDKLK